MEFPGTREQGIGRVLAWHPDPSGNTRLAMLSENAVSGSPDTGILRRGSTISGAFEWWIAGIRIFFIRNLKEEERRVLWERKSRGKKKTRRLHRRA